MIWLDRAEQAARVGLWIALGATATFGPGRYLKQQAEEARLVEAARKEELARIAHAAKAAEEAAKPERMSLAAVGSFMRGLNERDAVGRVWLTNASSKSGVICLRGKATNATSKESAESLVACKVLPPYASNVEVQLMFAGADLAQTCRGGSCSMDVTDFVEATAATVP